MNFSIIICTYNRVDLLKITLPTYNGLRIPENVKLEVIIVDNNSHDGTAEYVNGFVTGNKNDIAYSYVFESKQGLSHARNTGYKNAIGNYIAYTDDECILPEVWLEVAQKRILASFPAFLGGPYYGRHLPNNSNHWYKASFGDSHLLNYNLSDGPTNEKYLSGGNLIIRRDVFNKIGLFDPELGMNGETINYGEEGDFQKRLQKDYPSEIIFYDSKLFVWHFIRNEKMSIPYLFNDALLRGISSAKVANNGFLRVLVSPILLIYYLVRAIFLAGWRLLWSFFSKDHFFTLLHQDYTRNTWRSVGGAWYRSKLLLRSFSQTKL